MNRIDHKNWTRVEIAGTRYLLVKATGQVMTWNQEEFSFSTVVTDKEVTHRVRKLAA